MTDGRIARAIRRVDLPGCCHGAVALMIDDGGGGTPSWTDFCGRLLNSGALRTAAIVANVHLGGQVSHP